YTLKFLWAPLMDRFAPPMGLGRRRGWLAVTQVLLAVALLCVAIAASPSTPLKVFAIGCLIVTVLSASQDVVGDAYRTDVLPPDERAAGAAVWTTAYRVAMLAAGGGALLAVDRGWLTWPGAFAVAAGLMGVSLVVTLLAPEPAVAVAPPRTLGDAAVLPVRQLLTRRSGLVVIAFVVLFTLPEVLAKNMTLRFLLDLGVSKTEVAATRQVVGMAATIGGGLVGGLVAARVGMRTALLVFGILGAVSNLGFWVLAELGPGTTAVATVVGVDSFCGGLVSAGFVAFLMGQCDPRYSATQFALLSALMRVTTAIGSAPAGYVVQAVGWGTFFGLSALAAVPSLALLPWLKESPPAEDEPRGFEVLPARPSVDRPAGVTCAGDGDVPHR
ncbi:MAG TPA: MFS transporter, partial [Tepidisphaeraceae bacterium]|nr:MFS transporter [Tepidisphaeraceae bacterium]